MMTMTERRSWRALAREIYADEEEAQKTIPLPGEKQETALTARVRKLYEDSVVPVREIARIAGVTERTVYKYAKKQQWKPRYDWNGDGTRPQGMPCGWRARAALTPAQGAGGRFIARDDRGKPIAAGLQATDPQMAARAAQNCAAAALREHDAYVRAVRLRQNEERSRVWRRINKALDVVERHRKRMSDAAVRSHFGRRAHHPEVRARFWREDMQRRAKYGEQNDRSERPLWTEVRAAMEQLRVLREEQERTLAELEAQRPSGTS